MPQKFTSNPKFALSKSLKVGVLCGGLSSERKISLRSGRAIYKALKIKKFKPLFLDPSRPSQFKKRLKTLDVAFVALHGRGGEDGKLQKDLDRLGVIYTGSNQEGCRRSFDKVVSKRLFAKQGIPTPIYRVLTLSNWKKRASSFPVPFFVKPPQEGSSIGAFSVEDYSKKAEKLEQAIHLYRELLIEEKIEGREFTVGVLNGRALPVIELRPKAKFYDYHAKYTKGMTEYLVPAPISKPLQQKMQQLAEKVYRVLRLRDFSRIDMMTDEKQKVYVLEANAIPGFTELSLLPKAAKAVGLTFENLCSYLVELAYKRSLKK